ncbi:amidohydrolase family protein [Pseudonocardia sp. DSM 110487]|nr:amidohydrolase family protein [Pseudonocardia sp. DSM 110487]
MRTLIRNVRVFDGVRTIPRADVLISDDRIAEYDGRRVDVELEGTGKTLLPGLIDAHTHAFDGDLAQALRFGVTTELDMFCLPANLQRQRRLAAERDDVADIRSAGTLATAPNGHPSHIITPALAAVLGDAVGPFDTVAAPGQAQAFVDARRAEGIDYLKIVIDDGALSGNSLPTLSPETVAALVEAAHAAGLKTIAHVATTKTTAIALDAGIDGLAHVFSDVGPNDPAAEELAAKIAERNVFVTSTLSYIEVLAGERGGAELIQDERIASRLSEQARARLSGNATGASAHPNGATNAAGAADALHRAGVPLLAGTDATAFTPGHGASMHHELALLTRVGLTAEEALAAATSVPARCFGLTDRGRVAPGLRADLVLVDGDPTRDITATRSIVDVWRRGVRQSW